MRKGLPMKICIVYCNRLLRKTIQDFLTSLGHEVSLVSDDDLMSNYECPLSEVELLIVSLMNGKLSQRKQLQDIHNRFTSVPIIALTETVSSIETQEVMEWGVVAFLREPLQLRELELQIALLSKKCS